MPSGKKRKKHKWQRTSVRSVSERTDIKRNNPARIYFRLLLYTSLHLTFFVLSNELIISATQDGCRIALLKDKTLVEFHHEEEGSKFMVGDIYLGTVKKVVPGLNAAFIDVGYDKDAFLHYLDLGPQFSSLQKFTKLVRAKKITVRNSTDFNLNRILTSMGKLPSSCQKNQLIPVQIVKEPISTKGPRLSCELSLAGRYLVWYHSPMRKRFEKNYKQ